MNNLTKIAIISGIGVLIIYGYKRLNEYKKEQERQELIKKIYINFSKFVKNKNEDEKKKKWDALTDTDRNIFYYRFVQMLKKLPKKYTLPNEEKEFLTELSKLLKEENLNVLYDISLQLV